MADSDAVLFIALFFLFDEGSNNLMPLYAPRVPIEHFGQHGSGVSIHLGVLISMLSECLRGNPSTISSFYQYLQWSTTPCLASVRTLDLLDLRGPSSGYRPVSLSSSIYSLRRTSHYEEMLAIWDAEERAHVAFAVVIPSNGTFLFPLNKHGVDLE
jgi:hypothetical protein